MIGCLAQQSVSEVAWKAEGVEAEEEEEGDWFSVKWDVLEAH